MMVFIEGLLIIGLGGGILIALCMFCGEQYDKRYNNDEGNNEGNTEGNNNSEECENMKLLNA
tara:strand:+ start:336 stop:521 length:186 start_codon:yes stop_codon:yes gene_type:complete